jgi:glycosyltransferase involved in cell wall biosynthesis
MPYVSIICPTMRVGGLNILLDGLARQTFTDFELVLADGLYQRRKERVAQEARDRFLRVVHVAPEPNPFPMCAFCDYSNAALAAATGEMALFIVDYTLLPNDAVAKHAAFHKADATGRAGFMGPHQYIGLDVHPDFPRYAQSDVARYEEDVRTGRLDAYMWSIGEARNTHSEPHVVDGGGAAPWDADPKLRMSAGPIDAACFHAKNESVRLEHVIAAGGYDEDLDGAHAYQDSDLADRLSVLRGVKWTLDPHNVVDIANPRHVFPFARRLRDHASNQAIWQRKKASGYSIPPRSPFTAKSQEKPVQRTEFGSTAMHGDRLTIAMIYGEFSSAIHGPFDLEGLYTRAGLTGSESSFFNLARTLAERGHRVVAFCDCAGPFEHPTGLVVLPIAMVKGLSQMTEVNAVIAWNEPDYLHFAPLGVPRIVDQQLNDWGYCQPGWDRFVDLFVFPSESSRGNHEPQIGSSIRRSDSAIIPNSVDLDLFKHEGEGGIGQQIVERNPRRVVYCSSPDRGLHHLLAMWPDVRARVPDAELRIFYRLAPWLQRTLLHPDEVGRRARYIEAALARLSEGFGVTVVDLVPNAQMARELQAATVLAYPCDPVRYTEGFGCSVLDAAAGGCVPVISEADALPEVHKGGAIVVKGNPAQSRATWVDVISSALLVKGGAPAQWQEKMSNHARVHSREAVTDQWERLLQETIAAKRV